VGALPACRRWAIVAPVPLGACSCALYPAPVGVCTPARAPPGIPPPHTQKPHDPAPAGLVMFCKNRAAARRVSDEIMGHRIVKTYLARVVGAFPAASFPHAVDVGSGGGVGQPPATGAAALPAAAMPVPWHGTCGCTRLLWVLCTAFAHVRA
jgi:hypothetical protein